MALLPSNSIPINAQFFKCLDDGSIWQYFNYSDKFQKLYTADQIDQITSLLATISYVDSQLSLKANAADMVDSLWLLPFDFTNGGRDYVNPLINGIAGTDYNLIDLTNGQPLFEGEGYEVIENGFRLTYPVGVGVQIIGQTGQSAWLGNYFQPTPVLVYESFNPITYPPSWRDTTSTFSGWRTEVGVAQPFNKVRIKFRTRSNPVTSIRVFITGETGVILTVMDYTFTGLNLAANTIHDFDVDMGSVINTDLPLRVGFFCDQFIDRWGIFNSLTYPYPEYPLAQYQVNGNQGNGTLVTQSASSATYVNYIEFYNDLVRPTDELIDQIKDGIPELLEIEPMKEKLDATVEWDYDVDGADVYPEANAVLTDTTSTFSAWGTAIGIQNNFQYILTRIQARSSAITSVYWELRVATYGGTLLASGTVEVNILPNTLGDVICDCLTNIPNSGNSQLWFGWKANVICTAYGLAADYVFPRPTYGEAAYRTDGNQIPGEWTPVSSGTRNIWARVGSLVEFTTPTDAFTEELERKLSISGFVPTASLAVPSMIYTVEGIQTNLYFDNTVFSNYPLNALGIDITSGLGKHYDKFWRAVPVSSNAGNHSLVLDVLFDNAVITTKTANVVCKDANSGTSQSIKVLAVGDSTLAGGQPLAIINTDYQPLAKPSMTFLGTQGTAPNNHEAYGGYTFADFAGAGRTLYKFTVSGIVTAPERNSIYAHNGSQYTVMEVNLLGGSGYFSCLKTTGTNNPLSSGTLTKISGVGDASITFSLSEIISGNPFWNNGTSEFDFQNYLTTNGYTMDENDLILVHLGINDIYNITYSGMPAILASIKSQFNTMVAGFREAVPNINIALCVTIPPSISQDAFAANSNNAQSLYKYFANYQLLAKYLIDNFDSSDKRTESTFVLGFNHVVDREYNFPKASAVAVNARNTTDTIERYNNEVHPANSGYYQMGDAIYCFIKSLF